MSAAVIVQLIALLLISIAGVVVLAQDWRTPETRQGLQNIRGVVKGFGIALCWVWLTVVLAVVGIVLWTIIPLPASGPVVIPAWAFVGLLFWVCSSKCSHG